MRKTLDSKALTVVILFIVGISQVAVAAPINSVQDGDWGVNSTWDANSPGCTVTDDVTISSGDTVTCSCSPLDIKGNGSITIKADAKLIVTSNTGITGSGDLTVESGGALEVQGNLDLSGSGNFTLDGEADVYGDLNVSGSGTAGGSGDLDLGGTGCANFSGSCDENVSFLPVELTAFNATLKKERVLLNWKTASEKECEHYLVQRSRQKEGFNTIAQVKGAGTTVNSTSYSVSDKGLSGASTFYYRLVQVDRNGDRTVYGPIAVRVEGSSDELALNPNPLREDGTLLLPDGLKEKHRITVRDMSGRVLVQRTYNAHDGRIRVDKSEWGLKRGSYILSVRTGDDGASHTMRFIVK